MNLNDHSEDANHSLSGARPKFGDVCVWPAGLETRDTAGLETCATSHYFRPPALRFRSLAGILLLTGLVQMARASENVPHRPFAMWAEVPDRGQFVVGAVYEQSDAYQIWAHGQKHDIDWEADGGHYGIHINQGYLALQYGITEKWAADFNFGVTTENWRSFDNGVSQSTTGVMDWSFGVRYQIFNEAQSQSPWIPTLTFRAGAVLPGSYSETFAFSPGLRSAAIEPELLLRKHFAWSGFGGYGDGLYRWNRTTGNDQYIIALGLFQQLKQWELDLGWRHMQTISGSDIEYPVDPATHGGLNIVYPRDTREIRDSLEAGLSYTTSKKHFRYGVQCNVVLNGNNTDEKFWFGLSADFPFGGKSEPAGEKH